MPTTGTQKALILETKQGRLAVGSRDIPKPGPNQLLVKVLAASLNPVDWKIYKDGQFMDNYPAVLGTDVAGDVVEIGEGVKNFSVGDRVFFQGAFEPDRGAFQHYALSEEITTSKIPSKMSYEEVSTIPVAFTAAYCGLYNAKPYGLGLDPPLEPSKRGIYAGSLLVILGGSSSVGQYVIQLAKASGFSSIITTAAPKHAVHLRSLGATDIIDRNIPFTELKGEIEKLTNAPIKYVFDAISSKETQQAGHDLLPSGGHLIVVLDPTLNKAHDVDVTHVYGILALPQNRVLLEALYSKWTELLEDGVFVPNRYKVLQGGLQGILDGLEQLQSGQVSGIKLVVHPWE